MSVRDVFARLAAIRPLVILLDDLHWADRPSLMFLEHLSEGLSGLPILVIGTYRVEALSSSTPLHATLAKLYQRQVVETIEVGSLGEPDIDHLLTVVGRGSPPAALVRALHETTEGNPFFLSEVIAQLLEKQLLLDEGGWRADFEALDLDVPESVRLTIENRLQTLQPNTQRMLVAASPVGRSFDFDLLDALGDLDEDDLVDAIDEAERARLIASTIDAGGVRFSFAHELVRQTLLSQISHTRRQRLHLRIADALEHVHRASLSESAAAIAYHLGEAGPFADSERTSRFLTMAGERALEAAAFEEAVHHLRLVLSMVKDDDLETRAPCSIWWRGRSEASDISTRRWHCGTKPSTATRSWTTWCPRHACASTRRSKLPGGGAAETPLASSTTGSRRSATPTRAHAPDCSRLPG